MKGHPTVVGSWSVNAGHFTARREQVSFYAWIVFTVGQVKPDPNAAVFPASILSRYHLLQTGPNTAKNRQLF